VANEVIHLGHIKYLGSSLVPESAVSSELAIDTQTPVICEQQTLVPESKNEPSEHESVVAKAISIDPKGACSKRR
jgi:hypothetical protein